MGRPVNKRNFGDPADGTNLTVRAYVGARDTQAYIVAQKGTNKFKVSNNAGDATAICRLVNKATGSLVAGEMLIEAMDTAGERVVVKKLFNRTATDFNNNRYTWALEDDSTDTVLRLTAI
jgi:triphosphoribosyl-dephospho-CoA synthetase